MRSLTTALAILVSVTLVSLVSSAQAAPAPKSTIIDKESKPFGNPNAPQGGTFNFNLGAEPTTLHPINGTDIYNRRILAWTCDSLLDRNPDTNDFIPGLAERTEISADGTEFSFTLRKGVKWHDGQPLTAEDVKFSFDMIFDPKFEAAHMRPYYEGIAKAEVVDPQTVKFTAKETYFGNMLTLSSLTVLPKHIYGDTEKGKKLNKTLMCSGPYKLEKYDQGQSITLVRNKEWWGNNVGQYKGRFNFERIRLRFIKEEDVSLEMLKKGDLDFEELTPEAYTKKAVGPEWGKTAIKEKVENSVPKSYGYIGWNLRKDIFKNRDTREALTLLLNRKEIIEKFLFGMSLPATGPWYQQSEYADPAVKATPFDPKKAVELLKKARWTDADKNGVLEKEFGGKKTEFRFTLLYVGKDVEKYLVLFQSDLKKAGIDMQLQQLEWNALLKAGDDRTFDSVALAWGAGEVDLDPKQVWHSSSDTKGGSNRIGYNNPEIDKLIDQGRLEMDKKKRVAIFRQVYAKIASEHPYLFWFNRKFVTYAHSSKIKMPRTTFRYELGWNYWWLDDKK
jgi:peptide/nickel transport system substrate-binding protein/microcin C transport system substrate-binding protein